MLILLMGCHLLYAKIIREKIDFTTLAMMDGPNSTKNAIQKRPNIRHENKIQDLTEI
jgi:hypothetical protein